VEERPQRSAYIALEGELDLHRSGEIAAAFPAPNAVRNVTIDCTGVTYADSVALSILIKFRRDFVLAGGDPADIKVLLASGCFNKLFEIAGLTRLFVCERSETRSSVIGEISKEEDESNVGCGLDLRPEPG
jgi:anti-anti-sigma factor